MRRAIHESDVEENVLDILKSLGYGIFRGDNEDYLPGGPRALRGKFEDVVLVERLRQALTEVNPYLSAEVREQALKQVLRSESQKLVADNDFRERVVAAG